MIRKIKQHIRSIILLFPVLLLVACTEPGPPVVPGISLELARHRAAIVSDVSYTLELVIPDDQEDEIDGVVAISFQLGDASAPLQLDFREVPDKIRAVSVNGVASGYRFENEHIVIPTNEIAAGSNLVEIEFVVGDSSLNRNPEFLYTLFVPDRARTAFPLFDQPDIKATYDLSLLVPADWTAMSNAPLQSVTGMDGQNAFRFARSDLISSYLFSFVAGKFETVEREIDGRSMRMLHRETDDEKVARNIDAIFELHKTALDWLEEYTGIDYPYQKFGFVLIPSFQYGGMEHVGAIQYRADGLFLDESPSDTRLLGRAGLIAHETAHMWFGDLVTMEWFDDVWTKEVFANFMAAKIVNPSFPEINHDLNFLVRHYPGAYSVDRTSGANPIRQFLPNLNEAGQMYGAIIYNKAPIMMRQLEMMIGEELFREGMREYLAKYSFDNASWPALIEILDRKSDDDLNAWSEVWVNTPGRPEIIAAREAESGNLVIRQLDPYGRGRVWPQAFEISAISTEGSGDRSRVLSSSADTSLGSSAFSAKAEVIFNADGRGYGIFPARFEVLAYWGGMNDLEKGSVLVNLYESLLAQGQADVAGYFDALRDIVESEQNQLILNLALGQIAEVYWNLLSDEIRGERAPGIEGVLWQSMLDQSESSKKKMFFDAYSDIALSPNAIEKVYGVWSGTLVIAGLPLSEDDRIELSQVLAIKIPEEADEIIATQLANTMNPDSQRKLGFIAPSLSADKATRDTFFASLADEENRAVESWVLDALGNIHHPLRVGESEEYILASLELLQEIQVTGDIFFPKRWLDMTLGNYRSGTAVRTVRKFLEERPGYNQQLRMKILQSADMMFRANALVFTDRAQ